MKWNNKPENRWIQPTGREGIKEQAWLRGKGDPGVIVQVTKLWHYQ